MSKSIPHPFQYQGSKRHLAAVILGYFPKDVVRLVEPFAGSAALSIAAAAQQRAQRFWLNDRNQPLSELLSRIVKAPAATAAVYAELWQAQHESHSVAHYYQVRDDFNRTQDPHLLLYLLSRCVKGAVRYNAEGLFNQSPDKRRHGVAPATMQRNLLQIAELLQHKSQFSALDYRHVLASVNRHDLVYLDPPYQGVCGERDARYSSGIDHNEFIQALDNLNAREIPYLVSYDGRRGNHTFGETLPAHLALTRVELAAGRSSQATLLGRTEYTYESLYVSPALLAVQTKPLSSNDSLTLQSQVALPLDTCHA